MTCFICTREGRYSQHLCQLQQALVQTLFTFGFFSQLTTYSNSFKKEEVHLIIQSSQINIKMCFFFSEGCQCDISYTRHNQEHNSFDLKTMYAAFQYKTSLNQFINSLGQKPLHNNHKIHKKQHNNPQWLQSTQTMVCVCKFETFRKQEK